jgi:hypothetical protein
MISFHRQVDTYGAKIVGREAQIDFGGFSRPMAQQISDDFHGHRSAQHFGAPQK